MYYDLHFRMIPSLPLQEALLKQVHELFDWLTTLKEMTAMESLMVDLCLDLQGLLLELEERMMRIALTLPIRICVVSLYHLSLVV